MLILITSCNLQSTILRFGENRVLSLYEIERNFNQININWKCSLDLNEIPIEIHCEFIENHLISIGN